MRRKGAQSPLSLACISPSISFHRKPSNDGVSCCRSTLGSFSNLVSSVVSPSVLVVCSWSFFSRTWFFCCSRTSWYWRAACFSTPLVDFFLRLLLFLLVLGQSSPLVSSAVRESSTPSADGLGQIPVYERVSHPRHDQQEVEGTRHRRSFFLMVRHTVVEGCDHAQEGGAVPTQLGLYQSEHQFPQGHRRVGLQRTDDRSLPAGELIDAGE